LIRTLFVAFALTIGLSAIGHAQPSTAFVGRPPVRAVPEIDPGSATAALAMLTGGMFVLRAKRR